MTEPLALLLLVSGTLGWLSLAMIPGLSELLRPTDVAPLRVVRDFDGDIRHFATCFRDFVSDQLRAPGPSEGPQPSEKEMTAVVIPASRQVVRLQAPTVAPGQKSAILAFSQVEVSENAKVLTEVYGVDTVYVRRGSVVRAILGEEDIILEDTAAVLRWIHAEGSIVAGSECTLFGRASAEDRMVLGPGCRFQRIYAPSIVFGEPGARETPVTGSVPLRPFTFRRGVERSGGGILIRGPADVPAFMEVEGDVVVTGDLTIGTGVVIRGSVKSGGNMTVGADATVNGSLVAGGGLTIGPWCRIRGPLIAERVVTLGRGTVIGSRAKLATVTAPLVIAEQGVEVHGMVWARERGEVAAAG